MWSEMLSIKQANAKINHKHVFSLLCYCSSSHWLMSVQFIATSMTLGTMSAR